MLSTTVLLGVVRCGNQGPTSFHVTSEPNQHYSRNRIDNSTIASLRAEKVGLLSVSMAAHDGAPCCT